ncbi:MAG: hypothetical protein NWF00_05880 [Candidatus Bathyarchaeota archaeon]|nr:hypothetical protein [Candidatus Bathyarchaeota archaeon]
MNNIRLNRTKNAAVNRRTLQNMPLQNVKISPDLQQQTSIPKTRTNNAALSQSDLLNAVKAMSTTILMLQKENAELKAKIK